MDWTCSIYVTPDSLPGIPGHLAYPAPPSVIIPSLSQLYCIFPPLLIFPFLHYEPLGLPSFHHCFLHLAFLPPPLPCLIYSSSVSIRRTVTMLSVFFSARVENKTALYPSSCKLGTALTSSEKPDSQSDRQAGTNRVNL